MNKQSTENKEQTRDVMQAFAELQQVRYQQLNTKKNIKKAKRIQNRNKINSTLNVHRTEAKTLLESINNKGVSAIIIGLFAISIVMISTGYIFAVSDPQKSNAKKKPVAEFEENADELDILSIISENISITTKKELVMSEREVDFEIVKKDNPDLPKGEEVVTKEGVKGKEEVTYIKTYENDVLVSEVEATIQPLEPIIDQEVDVGTSEFLAKHKVHLEDTMYVTEDIELKEKAKDTAKTVCKIDQSLDVKLLELSGEEWSKVSFDDTNVGYVKNTVLASEYTIPDIAQKCRVKRIMKTLDFDMKLNEPSGLNLSDFKKILVSSKDKNSIIIDNAENFFKAEEKYNINGVFLASIAIHESAWGTSTIAKDKNNLFGYGSYDRAPYENSLTFETYKEGIDTVAKNLVKNYLNSAGTEIYDSNTATGKYYNGATVSGVNKRYASDENWCKKVYAIMESLYGKLQD